MLAPDPSDCRQVLAHLPTTYDNMDAENLVDSASPFFPTGQISHGSCGIQLTAHNVTESGLWLDDPLPLTISAVMDTWSRMEEGADSVISQCVDNVRIGSANHLVDPQAYPGLAYDVLVYRPRNPGSGLDEDLYRNLDQHMDPVHVDRFKKSRYIV